MRTLVKNKRQIYFQNIIGSTPEIVDGYETGNKLFIYSDPIPYKIMTSFPQGDNDSDMAGILSKYDKVAVASKYENTKIEEQARVFIETKPQENPLTKEYDNWDYLCEEVLSSLNNTIYGLSKRV